MLLPNLKGLFLYPVVHCAATSSTWAFPMMDFALSLKGAISSFGTFTWVTIPLAMPSLGFNLHYVSYVDLYRCVVGVFSSCGWPFLMKRSLMMLVFRLFSCIPFPPLFPPVLGFSVVLCCSRTFRQILHDLSSVSSTVEPFLQVPAAETLPAFVIFPCFFNSSLSCRMILYAWLGKIS